MKIKLLNYGFENQPSRKHYNDAGADVYSLENVILKPHQTYSFSLGFGLKLPDGYSAYVTDRSSIASKGLLNHLAPIDSGYTGEIHAIITNLNNHEVEIKKGDRIGQLVIFPTIICDLVSDTGEERTDKGFGSTGR